MGEMADDLNDMMISDRYLQDEEYHDKYFDGLYGGFGGVPRFCSPPAVPKSLPAHCPKHPTAMVRHSCDLKRTVLNGYPAGQGTTSNHRYECAECGTELANDPKLYQPSDW